MVLSPSTAPEHIGALVDSLLVEHRISRRQAATATGIRRTTLKRRIEVGDFRPTELALVASLLGTTASALVAQHEASAA